jgi:hypothetical protein
MIMILRIIWWQRSNVYNVIKEKLWIQFWRITLIKANLFYSDEPFQNSEKDIDLHYFASFQSFDSFLHRRTSWLVFITRYRLQDRANYIFCNPLLWEFIYKKKFNVSRKALHFECKEKLVKDLRFHSQDRWLKNIDKYRCSRQIL